MRKFFKLFLIGSVYLLLVCLILCWQVTCSEKAEAQPIGPRMYTVNRPVTSGNVVVYYDVSGMRVYDAGYAVVDLLQDLDSVLGVGNDANGQSATGFSSMAFAGCDNSGAAAMAEGTGTVASGYASHAEGGGTRAVGNYSHAEGRDTIVSGIYAHAEGDGGMSIGQSSHVEGHDGVASGTASHSEGEQTIASGAACHAEGERSVAAGRAAHAEGAYCVASGYCSHAAGRYAVAIHSNVYVWSDGFAYTSTDHRQYIIYARGGIYLMGGNTTHVYGVMDMHDNSIINISTDSLSFADGGHFRSDAGADSIYYVSPGSTQDLTATGGGTNDYLQGYIRGCWADYTSSNSVTITNGEFYCSGDHYQIRAPIAHSLVNTNVMFAYIYCDDSQSTGTVVNVYDSTNPPTYSTNYFGWYCNTSANDRVLWVVDTTNANKNIRPYYAVNDNYRARLIRDTEVRLASDMDPDSTWQTPDDSESSVYLPINAIGALVRVTARDASSSAGATAISVEGSTRVIAIQGPIYAYEYDVADVKGWVTLGASRNIRIGGYDNDDNLLNAFLSGYEIAR